MERKVCKMSVYSVLELTPQQEAASRDAAMPALRGLAFLFIIAVCCDTLSTIHFMTILGPMGPSFEINPLFRLAAVGYGSVVGPLLCCLFKIIAGFYVAWRLGRWAPYMFITGIIISFWAAWYNMWGCYIEEYIPGILTWNFWGV